LLLRVNFLTIRPIQDKTVEDNIMRRDTYNRKPEHDVSGVYQALKDRRKAYYHGKYNREVFSVVLLLACIGMFLLRTGI
tara:strand:+ start:4715 stop:4951 length:237 start_codon:yes stop_codon:yes gene_type:complete